jgi:hypothetical protein
VKRRDRLHVNTEPAARGVALIEYSGKSASAFDLQIR